eukprot:1144867-Pelagomonas_calceolata.AAC.5
MIDSSNVRVFAAKTENFLLAAYVARQIATDRKSFNAWQQKGNTIVESHIKVVHMRISARRMDQRSATRSCRLHSPGIPSSWNKTRSAFHDMHAQIVSRMSLSVEQQDIMKVHLQWLYASGQPSKETITQHTASLLRSFAAGTAPPSLPNLPGVPLDTRGLAAVGVAALHLFFTCLPLQSVWFPLFPTMRMMLNSTIYFNHHH